MVMMFTVIIMAVLVMVFVVVSLRMGGVADSLKQAQRAMCRMLLRVSVCPDKANVQAVAQIRNNMNVIINIINSSNIRIIDDRILSILWPIILRACFVEISFETPFRLLQGKCYACLQQWKLSRRASLTPNIPQGREP